MESFTRWLMSLPKAMFVTIVLAVGIIVIVLSNPPENICDAQVAEFKTSTASILALNPKDKFQTHTKFQKWFAECRSTKDPGGCFSLFQGVRQVLRQQETVSPRCFDQLGSVSSFSHVIWHTTDLMAKLAWGKQPPVSGADKTGFLDAADLSLYCRLQQVAINVYGQAKWQAFLEPYFTALPGAEKLSRDDAWSRMLFSVNCSTYY